MKSLEKDNSSKTSELNKIRMEVDRLKSEKEWLENIYSEKEKKYGELYSFLYVSKRPNPDLIIEK